MDTAQWPEGIGVVKSMEEKKPAAIRPQKPQALNCPRCNSTHTKFCYYNNYSLSQPRYFCKTCRRYWTEGGSLRNVPVGGGSRKNKRSSPSINSSSPASANSSKNIKLPPPDHRHMGVPPSFSQNPSISKIHDHQGQDLNLAYPPTGTGNVSEFLGLPAGNNSPQFSAMEFLKNGIANSRGMMMNSFMSMPMQIPIPVTDSNSMIYSTPSGIGLPFTEFKAGLNFTRDGFESGYSNNNNNNNGNGGGVQESTSTSARLFFPFEDLRAVSTSNDQQQVIDEQNRGHGDHSSGYWNNGGLGGGSW